MKKLLSLFLLTALVIGCIPFGIIAETEATELPFYDVKEDSWYYEAVKYSYENGIFKGTNSDGTEFSPDRTMTRAEFATTLFRVAGVNEADFPGDTGFSDVPAGKWMSAAVKWASEIGYVMGVGSNKFDPNGTLDRQQLATILYRFTSASFDTSDVDKAALDKFEDGNTVADWALEAMTWANSVKIINGNEKNLLVPEMPATRAQVAQILMNFENLYAGSDATGLVNRDLVFAINNNKYTEAKNIIYMIGDGMGYNIIEMTEHYYRDSLYGGKLAMNYIAQQSSHTSYSQSHTVTDSAAGGTALSSGYKTENNVIAQDPSFTIDYKTVLEISAEKGKSTGIIATKSVTDATPASFTAHTSARQYQGDIAEQQMAKLSDESLDLVLGGGIDYFNDEQTAPVLEQAVANNEFNYTESFDEALEMQLPLLGLFDNDMMDTFDESLPTIAEMTELALDKLSDNENGFFLMVEGSQIDIFCHSNDLEKSMHETYEFDLAVAVVLDFIVNNPDTVLIITADHETGGLIVPEELNDDTFGDYFYLSGSHSSRNVPVYALGYGVEELDKVNENVDLPIFVASLLGEENYGKRSENFNLISKTDEADKAAITAENGFVQASDDGVMFVLDLDNSELIIPISAFNTDPTTIKNARVIHIDFTNIGDKYAAVPSMFIGRSLVDPHLEYLNPGESATISYILPSEIWQDGVFGTIDSFGLYVEEPYFAYDPDVAEFLMGDIVVTERGLAN